MRELISNDCIGEFFKCVADGGYQNSKRFTCSNYMPCLKASTKTNPSVTIYWHKKGGNDIDSR